MEPVKTTIDIENFESFLEFLDIPDPCKLGKPIYKKMFLDNGVLNATDKAALKDDVEKIRWLYTLKSSTINIAPYQDDKREYPEVAVLHVNLTNPKRQKRIAHFINRSIPYPLLIFFTYIEADKESLLVSLADKRINQADKEKWVIEESLQTEWINLPEVDNQPEQADFIVSLKFSNLPFTNFWRFYQALIDRVIALNCAEHTGIFEIGPEQNQSNSQHRLELLQEIERLETKKTEIANKLKKEKQMGKQIELNTMIKKINDEIANTKCNL